MRTKTVKLHVSLDEQFISRCEDKTFFDSTTQQVFTYERYSMLVKKYGYGAQTHLNEKHILECFKSADTE